MKLTKEEHEEHRLNRDLALAIMEKFGPIGPQAAHFLKLKRLAKLGLQLFQPLQAKKPGQDVDVDVDWDITFAIMEKYGNKSPQMERFRELVKEFKQVTCSICGESVPKATAHLHQGKWIGDECCWDERLRASE